MVLVSYEMIGPPRYPISLYHAANSCRKIWSRRSWAMAWWSRAARAVARRSDAPSKICVSSERLSTGGKDRTGFNSSRVVYLDILDAFDSSITCSNRLSTERTVRSFFDTTDFARSPGRRKSNLATPYKASILSFRRINRTKKMVVSARMIAARLRVIQRANIFLWSVALVAEETTAFKLTFYRWNSSSQWQLPSLKTLGPSCPRATVGTARRRRKTIYFMRLFYSLIRDNRSNLLTSRAEQVDPLTYHPIIFVAFQLNDPYIENLIESLPAMLRLSLNNGNICRVQWPVNRGRLRSNG